MMNSAHEFEKTKGAQKQEPPASISKFSTVLKSRIFHGFLIYKYFKSVKSDK